MKETANPDPSAAREARKAKLEAADNLLDATKLIFDSSEVDAIKAELAAERAARAQAEAAKAAAESQLGKYTGVNFGMAQPEPADDYVPRHDIGIPGLNEANSGEVMAGADAAGRPSWKTSRVSHRLGNKYTMGQASTFWFYDAGGFARRIPNQSLQAAMSSGLWPVCPLCKKYHPESETNPNICEARKKVAVARCEICAENGSIRYIYDSTSGIAVEGAGDVELMEVLDLPSSPRERLRVRLEQHIRAYHPNNASSMKLGE